MAKSKGSAVKNIIVLFIIALVSVSILAVLNQITMEPIAKAEEEAKAAVYRSVYSDAAEFEEMSGFTGLTSSYAPADGSITFNSVLAAKDGGGNVIGYVIDATSANGYGGDVQIAVGISNEGTLTAFSVISASETPGLGARASEDEFASQFAGMPAEEIVFTKTGKSAPNEIDAISGATITTTAVTTAVNEAITLYNTMLKGE